MTGTTALDRQDHAGSSEHPMTTLTGEPTPPHHPLLRQ